MYYGNCKECGERFEANVETEICAECARDKVEDANACLGVVEIKPSDILWMVTPVYKGGPDKTVELQWGWTAGMTEEELKQYADDAPRGYEKVCTNLDMARELRDELDRIIKENTHD